MRIFKLARLAAVALAALPIESARADPTAPIVVFGALTDAGNSRRAAVIELRRRLTLFRARVRVLGGREPTFGPFVILDEEGLVGQPPPQRKPAPIAAMWGSASRMRARPVLRAGTFVFIGPLRVEHRLPRPTNTFATIRANVSLEGHDPDTDLETSVIIIGYALMLRIWEREPPALVLPIARALQERMPQASGGVNGTSRCLVDLAKAIETIRGLAANRRRPSALTPPFIAPDEIDCNPPD